MVRGRRLRVRSRIAVISAVVVLGGLLSGSTMVPPRAAASAAPLPVYQNTSYSFAERAADLVSRMTLSEKVQQLHTNSAPPIPRLGVQGYTYWSEGQHGVNSLGADQNNGGVQGGVRATSFPTNFASSMSWDPNLVYQETTAISDEARGFLDPSLFGTGQNNLGNSASNYGDLTFWAPTVNLDRDPRWGRTDEAFGEDPYLVSRLAGAFVNGYQGNTMTGQPMTPYLKVAATAKHYALNNVENTRLSGDSVTTDANLRDYYTKQFQSLIENAHVSGLMTSYNAVNGTPSAGNTYTVDQLAQRTYGFGGYITSDCGAVGTEWQYPPSGHAWAPPGWTSSTANGQVTWKNTTTGATIAGAAGAQAYALRAGTDLNCTGDEATLPNIEAAINAGLLSEGVIDTDLVRIFTVRMGTGEFDPRSGNGYTQITKAAIQSTAHTDLARTVADNALVLLKNDNVAGAQAPLLPVNATNTKKVVIVGDLANAVTLGLYSGNPTTQVSAVSGIKAALPNADVIFDAAGTSSTATGAAVLSTQTKADIQGADLVVIFAGTTMANADEGRDRASLAMPGNYDSLINQVTAVGNPRTALVLQSDGPVKIDDVRSKVPSILFSSYNGEEQGNALADVLLGKQNPDGHLNFTWYKDDSQLPAMTNYGLDAASTGGLGRTYQYFTGTPTYPFGHGLSYSSSQIGGVQLDQSTVSADGTVTASATVTNTGSRAGSTVAQLYVTPPGAGQGGMPQERLAGFQKTAVLAPGQTQNVTLPVRISDLARWNSSTSKEVVTPGAYTFKVGTDASSFVATKQVTVGGTWTPQTRYVTVQPGAVVYQAGQSIDLTGTNKWLADDTNPAEEPDRNLNIKADGVVVAVNNDESFVNPHAAVVSYASSDPSVASVSNTGVVRAIKDGVATITVTVNGVSGSTPIVVRGTLTSSVPPVVTPGTGGPASVTFTNGGAAPVTGVALTVAVPTGWTATATTPTTFPQVDGGKSVTATWTIKAATNVGTGTYPVTFSATSSEGSFTSAQQTSVPYSSIPAAYDNAGVSDDSAPGAGNLDGGGLSYSAQALAAAGFTSGQPKTVNGVTFVWPAAGQQDNIVTGGQTVPVSGSGATLGFLGASNNGTGSGTGTIVYTDGSTQSYALAFADWWAGSATEGSSIAATTAYINNGSGRTNQTVHLYYAGIPLQAGKSVRYVTLPDVTQNGQVQHVVAMHVFGIAVGG